VQPIGSSPVPFLTAASRPPTGHNRGRRQRPTNSRKSSLPPPPPTCAWPSKTTVLRVTHSRARAPLRRPDVAAEVNDTRTCVCILSATDAASHGPHHRPRHNPCTGVVMEHVPRTIVSPPSPTHQVVYTVYYNVCICQRSIFLPAAEHRHRHTTFWKNNLPSYFS